MDIIYVSSGCSEEKFEELRSKGITRKLPQAQKYHQLMVSGLAESIDGKVYVVATIPTNRTWSKQLFFHSEEESLDNICYYYIPFINIPVIGQISKYCFAKKKIQEISNKSNNVAIVCDVLNQSIADAAKKTGERKHIPLVGIVTDVPGHTSGARRKSYGFLKRKMADYAETMAKKKVSGYPAYLYLTEAMDQVVSNGKKPYIVIEGQCDYTLKEKRSIKKTIPNIAMYAGGIHKEFGIDRMVKAFIAADCHGWELHIYGDGNYQKELREIAKTNANVKYHGVVSNLEVTEKQFEASLLLNPRLTDAEYVKYSFPSKTMECMASGTPLLTTKLPGMPADYYPFVYFFDDESVEGMKEAFLRVLNYTEDELNDKGMDARQFVLKYKNNKIQAKKLIEFIESLMI